jgi:nucleotide-binding universal stress UspA family protein
MISKILLAYDGSDSAEDAFAFAVDLAGQYHAELHVLAVARPPDFAEDVETEAIIEHSRKHYVNALSPLKSRLAKTSLAAYFDIAVGHPAVQILRYAEQHRIDHIVVGHRGHTIFEHWLIGSVARQIIAHAHCAVTVVRK